MIQGTTSASNLNFFLSNLYEASTEQGHAELTIVRTVAGSPTDQRGSNGSPMLWPTTTWRIWRTVDRPSITPVFRDSQVR